MKLLYIDFQLKFELSTHNCYFQLLTFKFLGVLDLVVCTFARMYLSTYAFRGLLLRFYLRFLQFHRREYRDPIK